MKELDEIIDRFKSHPILYDDNVYICYEACKRQIRQMEKQNPTEFKNYNKYIKYVTEKLDI